MPTGYTAILFDKPETTFEEFVLRCARAFGALVEMRDLALDVPIPKKFAVSNYHIKAKAAYEKKLADLLKLSAKKRTEWGEAAKKKELGERKKYLAKAVRENSVLSAMVAKIVKWEPPSADHKGLKTFMLEQIGMSRNDTEWTKKDIVKIESKDPAEFYGERVETCRREIEYHTKQQKEEQRHCDDRSDWVKQLRDSLKPKEARGRS